MYLDLLLIWQKQACITDVKFWVAEPGPLGASRVTSHTEQDANADYVSTSPTAWETSRDLNFSFVSQNQRANPSQVVSLHRVTECLNRVSSRS